MKAHVFEIYTMPTDADQTGGRHVIVWHSENLEEVREACEKNFPHIGKFINGTWRGVATIISPKLLFGGKK